MVSGRQAGSLEASWNRTITLALDCKLMDRHMGEEETSILNHLAFYRSPNPSVFPIAPESIPRPTANNERGTKKLPTFRAGPRSLPPTPLLKRQQNGSKHKGYSEEPRGFSEWEEIIVTVHVTRNTGFPMSGAALRK